jgi:hypothetical protein
MIVNDFDPVRAVLPPNEADPPLIVDADAVLALPIATKRFQAVPGHRGEISQGRGTMKRSQPLLRLPGKAFKAPHPFAAEERFRVPVVERLNCYVQRLRNFTLSVKRKAARLGIRT